ncbi:hypothetical protein EYF80_039390 [Liparis tanakae]|uniref:Uncharacterized protein n=1 Tax=Liparis tanakae TaxID=230148 RepID=A0A4Z2GBW3_9TELE|nr:hypothetical protein EYF80_039390 [Liparis tanakae]
MTGANYTLQPRLDPEPTTRQRRLQFRLPGNRSITNRLPLPFLDILCVSDAFAHHSSPADVALSPLSDGRSGDALAPRQVVLNLILSLSASPSRPIGNHTCSRSTVSNMRVCTSHADV